MSRHDRRAAVRACLMIFVVPLAVGAGAAVGKIACGLEAPWGAVALLVAAALGTGLFLALFDWALDLLAERLLRPFAREERERAERIEPSPPNVGVDRLLGRSS